MPDDPHDVMRGEALDGLHGRVQSESRADLDPAKNGLFSSGTLQIPQDALQKCKLGRLGR